MSEGLQAEIAAFEQLLPEIRRAHGRAWAVVVGGRLQGAFETFPEAAEEAERRFEGRTCLIRHTDNQPASFPFFILEE